MVQSYKGIDNNPKAIFLIYSISIICHLIFICGLLFAPKFMPQRKFLTSVIDVRIVSLPEKKILSKQVQHKKIDQKINSKIIANTPKKSIKAVNLSQKKKIIKKSLKKRTYKSAIIKNNPVKQAERTEQKGAQERPDLLAEAFERLRQEVKTAEAGKPNKNKFEQKGTVKSFNWPAGKEKLELINIYRVEVAFQVQKQWAFSEQLAGGRNDLMTEIAFKIMPDGEICDIWFDKRSGNIYLDESARKAIIKSNPVHPHPEGIKQSYVIIGLRFTPEGLR